MVHKFQKIPARFGFNTQIPEQITLLIFNKKI